MHVEEVVTTQELWCLYSFCLAENCSRLSDLEFLKLQRNSEMLNFCLGKHFFFLKLQGEEPATHSSTRWEAGQLAHHWQLVGWQGTRHVGCQQLVSIGSLMELTHSHHNAGSSIISKIL